MAPKEDSHTVESGPSGDVYPKVRSISQMRSKRGILMDDAFEKTKFGIFNYFLVLISGVILGAVLYETCAISFVIPVSHCDLKLTTKQKGVLGAVSFIGMIFSSHLWGFLADTRGRKFVIMPTLFIAFIFAICSSFTDNFYIFAILRFSNGFFISGSSATIYAYLGEFHSVSQRGRAIMGSAVIFGIMCFLLPLIAWLVINEDWRFDIPFLDITYKPWRLFLVICSLPGFISSVALFFLPESPKFVLGQGKKNEAIEILRKINRWNNGKESDLGIMELEEEVESIENRERIQKDKNSQFPLLKSVCSQTVPIFKAPYLRPTILICAMMFGIYATANGFYMFFNDIINRFAIQMNNYPGDRIRICDAFHKVGANLTAMALLAEGDEEACITKLELETLQQDATLELIFVLGFALIGVVINKVGKYPILVFLLGVSGACGIVCMFSDIPLVQIYSFMALMCCGMAGNVVSAIVIEIYPTTSRAMAICMALMFGRLGSVVGSNVTAQLLNQHCELVFYLSGSSVLACVIFAFFIPNIHQRKPKNEITIDRRVSVLSRL